MELKEQLIAISTKELISSGASKESATAVAKWNVNNMSDSLLSLIQSYGNNCYNQALDDAADEVSLIIDGHKRSATIQLGNSFISVNSQSILNLKKH